MPERYIQDYEKLCESENATHGPLSRVSLDTHGIMSVAELATWLQVSKNTVPTIVARFGVREITGNAKNHRYAFHDVIRKVLGVSPQTPRELERLLLPLQKVKWVSHMTGMSVSGISANVCEKRGTLPPPIELTATGPRQAAARGRRWVPAQIESHLCGEPIPFLGSQTTAAKSARPVERNVFAEICASNSGSSPQF